MANEFVVRKGLIISGSSFATGDYTGSNLLITGTGSFGYISASTLQINGTNISQSLAGKSDVGHTHVAGDITNFSESVDDRVNSLLLAGDNITLNYNDGNNTLAISSSFSNFFLDGLTFDSSSGFLTASVSGSANQFVDLDDRWSLIGHTHSADEVNASTLGSPTYSTVQDFMNLASSPGQIRGGEISDGGSETINVNSGSGWIKAVDSDVAELLFFDWAATSSLSVPTDTTAYIGVEYNAGSPIITSRAVDDFDLDTEFPLGQVTNDNGDLHIINNPWWVGDPVANIIERFQAIGNLIRDERFGGLILGETGTRNVTLTAGTLWSRLSEFEISAIDTSGSDTFTATYRDGSGGWTNQTLSQWPNTQYDDGSGTLANMGNNRYANLWFYIETDGHLTMVYPQATYPNQSQAETEQPPSEVPRRITETGVLVGRILFTTNASTATLISSAFDTVFSTTGVTDHGNLSGLTDDDHPQYHTDARGDARYSQLGHTHSAADITNFSESVDDRVNDLLVAGDNITLNYDDVNNQLAISSSYVDTNFYLDGLTFTNGILTGSVLGASDQFVSLDGRYSLIGHSHTVSDITDFNEGVDDRVSNLLVAGDNITLNYDDGGNSLAISSSFTNNYVDAMTFNTGDGVLTLGRNGLTDLTEDLDGRWALLGHSHTWSDLSDVNTTLAQINSIDQNLSTGSNVEFNSIDINGSAFVDSSRNVSAFDLTVEKSTTDTNFITLFGNRNSADTEVGILFRDRTAVNPDGDEVARIYSDRISTTDDFDLVFHAGLGGSLTSEILRLTHDGDVQVSNTLTINSQLLFNLGGEQTLDTGSSPIFNDATINGELFSTHTHTESDITDFGTYQTASVNLDVYDLNPLTADELTQLQNINSVTISNTQWGYLGSLDQDVSSGSNVEFNSININGSAFVDSSRNVTAKEGRFDTLSGRTFTIYDVGENATQSGEDHYIILDLFSTGSSANVVISGTFTSERGGNAWAEGNTIRVHHRREDGSIKTSFDGYGHADNNLRLVTVDFSGSKYVAIEIKRTNNRLGVNYQFNGYLLGASNITVQDGSNVSNITAYDGDAGRSAPTGYFISANETKISDILNVGNSINISGSQFVDSSRNVSANNGEFTGHLIYGQNSTNGFDRYSVSVNDTTFADVTFAGAPLEDFRTYRIRLATSGTGTNTGYVGIVWNDGSGNWNLHDVSYPAKSSNHPYLIIENNTVKIRTSHSTLYNIIVSIESVGIDDDAISGIWGADSTLTRINNTTLFPLSGGVEISDTLTINGTLLFNKGGEQTLDTGSNVEFNSININGSTFVDSSRNVFANDIQLPASGTVGSAIAGTTYYGFSAVGTGLHLASADNAVFDIDSNSNSTAKTFTITHDGQAENLFQVAEDKSVSMYGALNINGSEFVDINRNVTAGTGDFSVSSPSTILSINRTDIGATLDFDFTGGQTNINSTNIYSISFNSIERLEIGPTSYFRTPLELDDTLTINSTLLFNLGGEQTLDTGSNVVFNEADFTGRTTHEAGIDGGTGNPLTVYGSGSVVFDIQGSLGQLFSVTDDFTGTLFSVNDISGIPILQVNADDTVKMGTFNAEGLIVSGSQVNVNGTLLFNEGGEQTLDTGSSPVFADATINGELFSTHGHSFTDISGTATDAQIPTTLSIFRLNSTGTQMYIEAGEMQFNGIDHSGEIVYIGGESGVKVYADSGNTGDPNLETTLIDGSGNASFGGTLAAPNTAFGTDNVIIGSVGDGRYSQLGHTHTESDITDLGNYALVGHTHPASDITSGTFADARISATSVQQHIDKAYIDGLNVDADTLDGNDASAFATAGHTHALDDLSDVVLTSPSTDDFLQYNGTNWVNASVSAGSSLWADDGDGSISYNGRVDIVGSNILGVDDIIRVNGAGHISIGYGNGVTNPYLERNSSGGLDIATEGSSGDIASGNPVFQVIENGANRFYIQGDGNVGIGTTSPSAKLDVNGHFNVDFGTERRFETDGNSLYLWRTAATGNASGYRFKISGAGTLLGGYNALVNGTELNYYYIGDDHNNPLLQVNPGGDVNIRAGINGSYGESSGTGNNWGANIWAIGVDWSSNGAGSGFSVGNHYGITWLRDSHADADSRVGEGLYVWQNGALRTGMGSNGIYSTGNINVSKTTARLILTSNASDNTTTGGIKFVDSSNDQNVELVHDPYDSSLPEGGYGLVIRKTADNTQQGNDAMLVVEGNVHGNDMIASSDARIKSNEHYISNALDSLRNINAYTFDKKGKRKAGYFAQNVEKWTEGIVTKSNREGYKDFRTMDLMGMQAYNTQAIKELDSIVSVIDNHVRSNTQRIKSLEKENESLRKELNKLRGN